MTYVNKRTRLFLNINDKKPASRRSEARLKTYPSEIDARAWCDTVEERRQHILELVTKGRAKCGGKLIPLDALIDFLMESKNADIRKLKNCLNQLWTFIDRINLAAEDKTQLITMKENMDVICTASPDEEEGEYSGSSGKGKRRHSSVGGKSGPGSKKKIKGSAEYTEDSTKQKGKQGAEGAADSAYGPGGKDNIKKSAGAEAAGLNAKEGEEGYSGTKAPDGLATGDMGSQKGEGQQLESGVNMLDKCPAYPSCVKSTETDPNMSKIDEDLGLQQKQIPKLVVDWDEPQPCKCKQKPTLDSSNTPVGVNISRILAGEAVGVGIDPNVVLPSTCQNVPRTLSANILMKRLSERKLDNLKHYECTKSKCGNKIELALLKECVKEDITIKEENKTTACGAKDCKRKKKDAAQSTADEKRNNDVKKEEHGPANIRSEVIQAEILYEADNVGSVSRDLETQVSEHDRCSNIVRQVQDRCPAYAYLTGGVVPLPDRSQPIEDAMIPRGYLSGSALAGIVTSPGPDTCISEFTETDKSLQMESQMEQEMSIPKIMLDWDVVKVDEHAGQEQSDQNAVGPEGVIGGNLSKILSGEAIGVGIIPNVSLPDATKTLSGEILQKRLSDRKLDKIKVCTAKCAQVESDLIIEPEKLDITEEEEPNKDEIEPSQQEPEVYEETQICEEIPEVEQTTDETVEVPEEFFDSQEDSKEDVTESAMPSLAVDEIQTSPAVDEIDQQIEIEEPEIIPPIATEPLDDTVEIVVVEEPEAPAQLIDDSEVAVQQLRDELAEEDVTTTEKIDDLSGIQEDEKEEPISDDGLDEAVMSRATSVEKADLEKSLYSLKSQPIIKSISDIPVQPVEESHIPRAVIQDVNAILDEIIGRVVEPEVLSPALFDEISGTVPVETKCTGICTETHYKEKAESPIQTVVPTQPPMMTWAHPPPPPPPIYAPPPTAIPHRPSVMDAGTTVSPTVLDKGTLSCTAKCAMGTKRDKVDTGTYVRLRPKDKKVCTAKCAIVKKSETDIGTSTLITDTQISLYDSRRGKRVCDCMRKREAKKVEYKESVLSKLVGICTAKCAELTRREEKKKCECMGMGRTKDSSAGRKICECKHISRGRGRLSSSQERLISTWDCRRNTSRDKSTSSQERSPSSEKRVCDCKSRGRSKSKKRDRSSSSQERDPSKWDCRRRTSRDGSTSSQERSPSGGKKVCDCKRRTSRDRSKSKERDKSTSSQERDPSKWNCRKNIRSPTADKRACDCKRRISPDKMDNYQGQDSNSEKRVCGCKRGISPDKAAILPETNTTIAKKACKCKRNKTPDKTMSQEKDPNLDKKICGCLLRGISKEGGYIDTGISPKEIAAQEKNIWICRAKCAYVTPTGEIKCDCMKKIRDGSRDKQKINDCPFTCPTKKEEFNDMTKTGKGRCRGSCAPSRKDAPTDIPSLIIHKDAEIIALNNALSAKEAYCAEQRKIAAAAIEQLENIKNIVEERDDLRKKLENSQEELEELKRNIALGKPYICGTADRRAEKKQHASQPNIYVPFVGSKPTEPNSCEEEISALEKEIDDIRNGKLTPELEAQVIRKEVEVMKKYCSRLSIIQAENYQLKQDIAKYEETMNLLGLQGDSLEFEDLKTKVDTLTETIRERDMLKLRVEKLEKELYAYNDLPEDIEVFKQRSMLLDEVLQDRDRLSKRVEQLRGIDEEVHSLRKKSSRVDELEGKLKSLMKDKNASEDELEILRCKCTAAEIEALNQKADGDTLRSRLVCMENELESMKCICKERERFKLERDQLQRSVDELLRMQGDYDHMSTQMKCLDILKAEKDMYKSKYENLIGLECECDILRAQVEKAKYIEKERDALENQVEDLESCIVEQEDEIRRLVCHIDTLAQGRDEQQEKLKGVLCVMRAELERKECVILSSEEKLAAVQDQLRNSIEGLSCETANLRSRNDKLEREVMQLRQSNDVLQCELQEKDSTIQSLSDAKPSEHITNQLTNSIEGLDGDIKCLANQNEELKKEVCHCKQNIAQLRDEIQQKNSEICTLQGVLLDRETTFAIPNPLDRITESNLTDANQNIHDNIENLVTYTENLEKEICRCKEHNILLQTKLEIKEREVSALHEVLSIHDSSDPDSTQIQNTSGGLNTGCEAANLMKRELEAAKAENRRLQKTVAQMGSVTGDQHLQEMLRQSKCAIERIAEELSKQYEEWDCIKKKLKQQKAVNENEGTEDSSLWDCKKKGAEEQRTTIGMGTEDYTQWDCKNKGVEDWTKWDCKKIGTSTEDWKQWDCMKGKFADGEDRIAQLEKELAKAYETIADLQGQLAAADRMHAENAALRRHSFDVQEVAKDQIEELVDHLKKARDKVTSLEEGNAILNDKLNDMRIEKDGLTGLIKDLQEKNAADSKIKEACLEEKAKLEEEVKLGREHITQLETEIADLQNLSKETDDLKKQLEALQAETDKCRGDAETERQNCKAQAEKFLAEINDLNKQVQNQGQLEDEIAALKKERGEMEQMLASNVVTTCRRSSKLENELQSLTNQVQELQEENARLKATIESLENQGNEFETLKSENEKLQNELDRANKELEDLKNLNLDAANMDTLKTENDKLKAELADLLDKMKQPPVQVCKTANERYLKDREALQAIIDDLENQLKNVVRVCKKAKTLEPSDDLQKIIDDLTRRLEEEQRRANDAEEALRKLKTSDPSVMLNDEINQLRQRLAELENENNRLNQLVTQSNNEIARLTKELETVVGDNAKLKETIGKYQADNEQLKNMQGDSQLVAENAKLEGERDRLQKDLDQMSNEMKKAYDKVSQLQDENGELKQGLAKMESENSKLKKELEAALNDMNKISEKVSQLEKENAKYKQDISNLEAEIARLKKELDALLNDAKRGTAGVSDLQDELAALKQKLAQLENENNKLKKDLDTAVNDAKSGASGVTQLRGENDKLKQANADLEKMLADLRKELDAAKKALADQGDISSLRDKLAKLEAENSSLKSDLNSALADAKKAAELQQKLALLEGENSKLKKDLESSIGKGVDPSELNKLKDRIAKLEEENAKLKSDLNTALDDLKKAGNTIAQLQAEDTKNKQRLAQLEADNSKMKKDLDQSLEDAKKAASMRDDESKLKQRIAQLEAENSKLKKELDDALAAAKNSSAQLQQLKDEIGKLKQNISQLETEKGKLQSDLDTAKAKGDDAKLKDRIAQLEAENAKLKKDLASLTEEHNNCGKALSQLQDEIAKLKSKCSQLETENSNFKKNAEGAMGDFKKSTEENEKLKQQIAQLNKEIAALNAELKNNANAMAQMKENEATLKQKIAQLEAENAKLKSSLDSAVADAKKKAKEDEDKLRQRLAELEANLKSMQDDDGKLKQKYSQLEGENMKLKKDLEKALADAEASVQLREENKKLKEKIAQLEKEIAQLKKDLSDALDEAKKCAQLQEKLNQLEKDNAKLKSDLQAASNLSQRGSITANQLKDENAKQKQKISDLESEIARLKKQLEAGAGDKVVSDNEAKLKELQAELARQKKECDAMIAKLKEQFDRDMRNLLKQNEESIAKLQKAHEDALRELNEKHDNAMKSLQDALRKAQADLESVTAERDKMKNLLDDQRKKSIEIKDKVEQVETVITKERKTSKDLKCKCTSLEKEKKDIEKDAKEIKCKCVSLELELENRDRRERELECRCKKLEKENEEITKCKLCVQKQFEEELRKGRQIEEDMMGLKKELRGRKRIEKLTMTTFECASVASKFPEVIAITAPLSDKELKFFGKQSSPCDVSLESIINKVAKAGIESLGIEELQMLHTVICDATANVLEKLGQSSGVLKPNENNKLSLMRRIASLEGDLLKKQKHAQQKVTAMQFAVKLEKERLSDLRKSLEEEKQKNTVLLNQIGSQSKVVSNIQEERDLIQRQKSYHEEKLEQYIIKIEEERAKSRTLEDELDKERTNIQHLKNLLEAERERARQNKRKDTEALETMRIKLEKTVNSEMMLRMKLQEKMRRRSPSPGLAPVRDSPYPSRCRPSQFYTEVATGGRNVPRTCPKSCLAQKKSQSTSSSGLDDDRK